MVGVEHQDTPASHRVHTVVVARVWRRASVEKLREACAVEVIQLVVADEIATRTWHSTQVRSRSFHRSFGRLWTAVLVPAVELPTLPRRPAALLAVGSSLTRQGIAVTVPIHFDTVVLFLSCAVYAALPHCDDLDIVLRSYFLEEYRSSYPRSLYQHR